MKAKDLTGQRFGRLTVMYKNYDIKRNSRYPWHCCCDCGKEKDVFPNDLLQNKTLSCGCLQKEKASVNGKKTIEQCKKIHLQKTDITGKRFNKLTVIKYIKTENKHRYWLCKCDCGNTIITYTSNLTTGNIQSCGCLVSIGQSTIAKLLTENNISFVQEKSFNTCISPITGSLLRFDFYVDNKYIIEFDGIQHFQEIDFFDREQSLECRQKLDEYKNNWCKQNNIPIIRIPYTKSNININDLILEQSEFIIK